MTHCTLSPEVYRWQHNGGWRTGRLVMSDGNVLTRQHGEIALRDCFTDHRLLVFDPLAEAPGLSFIPWGGLERYERGP